MDWIEIVGPHQRLYIFGIRMVGFNADSVRKLLLSITFIVVIVLLGIVLRRLTRLVSRTIKHERIAFWIRQAITVTLAVLLIISMVSIWFDDPSRFATGFGLLTAGLAFALQRVVTALAGYLVILRGKTFTVGDRITMGGVRGDVIALGLIQTTIMEMGQPPAVQKADPAQWVKARQYSGRVVTVSNDKIFDTPVYNYSRHFPYIWEEMNIPVAYRVDRAAAERIMLEAAKRHTIDVVQLSEPELAEMHRLYLLKPSDVRPRVYWRLTDNWLELTVRFLCSEFGVREVKDAISRDIVDGFDAANIGIASATMEVVGLPTLHIEGRT